MKKLSLLLGTLGGALAGYLFSKPRLRTELSKAKDAEHAAKVFARHLKEDGAKIGKEVKAFVNSDDVQDNLQSARTYVEKQFNAAKKEVRSYVKQGQAKAKTAIARGKATFKQEKVK